MHEKDTLQPHALGGGRARGGRPGAQAGDEPLESHKSDPGGLRLRHDSGAEDKRYIPGRGADAGALAGAGALLRAERADDVAQVQPGVQIPAHGEVRGAALPLRRGLAGRAERSLPHAVGGAHRGDDGLLPALEIRRRQAPGPAAGGEPGLCALRRQIRPQHRRPARAGLHGGGRG